MTRQKVEEHKESLAFFTGDRWLNLVPTGEENQRKKCMIRVRTNIDRPSNPPPGSDPGDVQQFTIEYEDFVRGKICDDEVPQPSVRDGEKVAGLTPARMHGYREKQLQETCSILGIPWRASDINALLVAKIKSTMGWGRTHEELPLVRAADAEKAAEISAAEADQVACRKRRKRG